MNVSNQHASIFFCFCILQTAVKAPALSVNSSVSWVIFLSLPRIVTLFLFSGSLSPFTTQIQNAILSFVKKLDYFVPQTEFVR